MIKIFLLTVKSEILKPLAYNDSFKRHRALLVVCLFDKQSYTSISVVLIAWKQWSQRGNSTVQYDVSKASKCMCDCWEQLRNCSLVGAQMYQNSLLLITIYDWSLICLHRTCMLTFRFPSFIRKVVASHLIAGSVAVDLHTVMTLE